MPTAPFHYSLSCRGVAPNPTYFYKVSKPKGAILSEKKKISRQIKLKQAKVNLYPEQHLLLVERAKENGTNISEYIRQKLDLTLQENHTRKTYKEHKEVIEKVADQKLVFQLAKIGNNLNQITYKINKKEYVPNVEVLENLVEIKKIYKELQSLL